MPGGSSDLEELLRQIIAGASDSTDARARWFEAAEAAGHLNKLRVATYRCEKGCTLIDVIRLGDLVLARSADYKLRPRTNTAQSVPSARAKNLNRDNHWPSHVFDVSSMAADALTGIPANCRHGQRTVMPQDILDVIENIQPGHAGAPIRIS